MTIKQLTRLIPAGLCLAFSCLLVACLGGGSSATTPVIPNPVTPTLALFAGNMGGPGNNDGPEATAHFGAPYAVATDTSGNVYVADSGNNTIRKITPSGVVSTLAGTPGVEGSADGSGAAASFNYPSGIAADSVGNVYVADSGNNIIRKITPTGVVSTLAGMPGVQGSADGSGAAARFNYPTGVATDSAANIYVVDKWNYTIRKITPGGLVTTLAGTPGIFGSADGTGVAASFFLPTGVATDSAGNVYVADSDNNMIRKITPAGVVSTFAGSPVIYGSADGTGAEASFYYPTGVATDSAGNVYVADSDNNTIRKISPAGVVSTLAGAPGVTGSADGTGASASFYFPTGVATDSTGNVYVADSDNNTIRKIAPAGVVSTLAGTPAIYGSADGTGAAASFTGLDGVATDSAGNVYMADFDNNTIRKITPAGVVTTLAGTPGIYGSADGTGAVASFHFPAGVATDSSGNIYVADSGNNTIRKISPTGEVSTLAGAPGVTGGTDGTGAAASFDNPNGIATDSIGNVYVANTGTICGGGFSSHPCTLKSTIRKITPAGVVSTLAGSTATYGSADGTGAAASFYHPNGIATDSVGNVYVADTWNNTIRKITPAGAVSTFAGRAGVTGSADGTGGAASFNYPAGVATDSAGNVYVADTGNNTIRKITPNGLVSTVVGVAGVSGFLPGSLPGVLPKFPKGVAISGTWLYITANSGVAVVNNVP
ncbi:MAG: NHL repeat-containing protein [Gallionellaceae bacterium]